MDISRFFDAGGGDRWRSRPGFLQNAAMPHPTLRVVCALLVACGLAGCRGADDAAAVRALADDRAALREPSAAPRCAAVYPEREAFFGDLHVHTSMSSDAWMFDVRLRPRDAYRYAFGEPVLLPPLDSEGRPTREVRIDRPLDFAAVTDHAEFLGEGVICTDPEAKGYESEFCETFRNGTGRDPALVFHIMSPWNWRDSDTCGDDDVRCREKSGLAWQETIEAAESWNDTTDTCERTTFVAYEYSSFRLGSNLHRNVIFRNATVPALPTSYLDVQREWDLWETLRSECVDAGTGCDAIAIPHNSNISNGRMFAVDYPGAWSEAEQRARAALRARIEPLVEIMQHKGDSECRNGLEGVLGANDELCDFEKFENLAFDTVAGTSDVGTCYAGPLADYVPHLGPNCVSRLSYVRHALVEGLREEQRIGVNPFKFGLSASTDTHNGMAGGVVERTYPGHLGKGDETAVQRVQLDKEIPGNNSNNPGGLIGVWAEENSRDALFDAMERREVFGTSGPRVRVRFFGSWDYADDLCEASDAVARSYAGGVPMGSDLPPKAGDSPVFVAMATQDPGTVADPGVPLQRLQVVKGWADDDGSHHQRVFEIAGSPDNGASVDLDTCTPRGAGHKTLCSVWRDPEFDPEVAAVYYLRAVENPSCRYSTWQCLGLPESERPQECASPPIAPTIQERAWSSPLWYGGGAAQG
jgi:hypothetical protein